MLIFLWHFYRFDRWADVTAGQVAQLNKFWWVELLKIFYWFLIGYFFLLWIEVNSSWNWRWWRVGRINTTIERDPGWKLLKYDAPVVTESQKSGIISLLSSPCSDPQRSCRKLWSAALCLCVSFYIQPMVWVCVLVTARTHPCGTSKVSSPDCQWGEGQLVVTSGSCTHTCTHTFPLSLLIGTRRCVWQELKSNPHILSCWSSPLHLQLSGQQDHISTIHVHKCFTGSLF